MKILFRRGLRRILTSLCLIAVNKHQLEIIAVGGWYGTDIAREAVFTILKRSGKKVRRIIHSPQYDWDIPLTILGINEVPTNPFAWITTLTHAIARLLFLKPNSGILVLQINSHDAGIMKYWMSFLSPSAVIVLNSHPGSLNLELLLVEKMQPDGILVLNNDNMRTKSLAQGKTEGVVYFGIKEDPVPDYYFVEEKQSFMLGHAGQVCVVEKSFPEFIYPLLTASVSLAKHFEISFDDACNALNTFEIPSDKIQTIFHRFIEEE